MARDRSRGRQSSNGPKNEIADPRDREEVRIRSVTWQAPLPPPDTMRGYDDVITNGAERVFQQFEAEASARRAYTRRGQTFGFVIQVIARLFALSFALAALYVAYFALEKGHEWAATIIGGSAIAMVVTAFIGNPFRRHEGDR